jgi:hypothetical protein
MTQPLYTVRQLAYVVRDMDAALKYWIDVLKVGPFFTIERAPLENQKLFCKATNTDVSIALGNSGDLQIELIVQNNDEPSVYREFLDSGRVGVHHFGLMPEDYGATCEQYRALGHQPAFECTIGGVPLVYFDTVKTVGHYIELWDNHPMFKDLFLTIEKAAQGWDGTDPVRPLRV